jgi:hypothetical protein
MGITNKGGRIREIGIRNTTSVAFAAALALLSAAGTPGAALTEWNLDGTINALAPSLTGFNTHTADATVSRSSYHTTIGAAAGAGETWTFGEEGLLVPTGTANGIAIICPAGTGQIFDFWFVWDE